MSASRAGRGLLTAIALISCWHGTTGAVDRLPPLKTGDIVFQDLGGLQGEAIKLATASPYSHVGMVELRKNGKPMVIEAIGPVRTIAFERWMRNGTGRQITIKRVKGLTEAEAKAAVRRAHVYDGRPYDYFFTDGRDAIYCSELVHAAFKEGAGIALGAVEEVRGLAIDNDATKALIKARWKAHPFCQTAATSTFEACYPLILHQTLVSPAAIARDPKLETMYSSFGTGAD